MSSSKLVNGVWVKRHSPPALLTEQKVILFRIPKVIHSSVGVLLYKSREAGMPLTHIGLDEVQDYPEYKKICIVRNPFDRLVSLYMNRNRNEDLLRSLGYMAAQTMKDALKLHPLYTLTFKEFIHKILNIQHESADRHYSLQADQLTYDGSFLPDTVLKFEEMENTQSELLSLFPLFKEGFPHKNKTERKLSYKEYYDEGMVEKVRKWYMKDLLMFDYDY